MCIILRWFDGRVLPGTENSAILIFPSHKIIVGKQAYIGSPVLLQEGLALGCEAHL
jgi:hypothetical protein